MPLHWCRGIGVGDLRVGVERFARDRVELRGTDEDGQAASGGEEAEGQRKSPVELFDSAEGHNVGDPVGDNFGAFGDYIDVRQCKCADDFAEKSCLPVIGFDESQLNLGRPDFYGKTGKTGTGAEVEDGGQWFVSNG